MSTATVSLECIVYGFESKCASTILEVIPEGYTFLNAKTLITVKGKKIADELLEASEKRDPDAFDMYIYNGKSVRSRRSW